MKKRSLRVVLRQHLRYKKVSTIYFMLDKWWRDYCEIKYVGQDEDEAGHERWVRDTDRSVNKAWKDINYLMKGSDKKIQTFIIGGKE